MDDRRMHAEHDAEKWHRRYLEAIADRDRLAAELAEARAVLRDWVAVYKGCVLTGDEDTAQLNILYRARALLDERGK